MIRRLILLDDDPDVVDSLDELLRALGVVTVAVQSLAELVGRRDEALVCELAILDLNLGPSQATGLDAFEWLRDDGYSGRVVFLTGHDVNDPLVDKAAAEVGAQLLRKPIGLEELRVLLAHG